MAALLAAAVFCGLVRSGSGYDPVAVVHGRVPCAGALFVIERVDRGRFGGWQCSRGARRSPYELKCREGSAEIWILERIPARPRVLAAPPALPRRFERALHARLANWEFALAWLPGRSDRGPEAFARRRGRRWLDLGPTRGLVCVDEIPLPVLRAWRLRPRTPRGGCFATG
jgi:hypothetical protein